MLESFIKIINEFMNPRQHYSFCFVAGVELKQKEFDFNLTNVFQKLYDTVVKGETPQAPALPPPPPMPDAAAAEASRKAAQNTEDAASAEKRQRGRAATVLTGTSGATGTATTSSRTLLGA